MRRHEPFYKIRWSAADQEFVGTCPDYPSLSWLDPDPAKALNGIRQLVLDTIAEENKTHAQATA